MAPDVVHTMLKIAAVIEQPDSDAVPEDPLSTPAGETFRVK